MKKIIITILTIVLCSFSAVYASGKDTLVTAWPVNSGPLNPHLYSPNQMYAQVLVYDALVRYDGRDIEPALAESWDVSEDGMTYTFHLRKGVKFSDGTAFDSAAVAKNFEAVMANSARHGWLALVKMIDGWSAPDSHTFVLKLKSPYIMTLTELSLPRPFRMLSPSGFLPEESNTSKGIAKPVGTGPWMLAESKLGQYDLFERNPGYWGEKPEYSKILVKVLPDGNSRVVALETGEVDILIGKGSFTVENFVRLSKDSAFATEKSGPRSTNMVVLNSKSGPTADINVRRAVLHAVNKDAIVQHILLGLEQKADTLYQPALKYCDLGLEPYEYSPEKSEKLLDEAGWTKKGRFREKDGQRLVIDLHFMGTNPKQKAIAEAIQADLYKVGITVEVNAEEETIFYSLQNNGRFGMIFNATWGPPYEPGSFTASMRKPSHADYQGQAGLPEKEKIDQTITDLLVSTDEADITEKYRYVLTALHEGAVYLPISYERDLAVYRKGNVKGFVFGEMSTEFLFNKMSVSE